MRVDSLVVLAEQWGPVGRVQCEWIVLHRAVLSMLCASRRRDSTDRAHVPFVRRNETAANNLSQLCYTLALSSNTQHEQYRLIYSIDDSLTGLAGEAKDAADTAAQKGTRERNKAKFPADVVYLGAELKEQASEKVDQAKNKANQMATDAKKKGQAGDLKDQASQKADQAKHKANEVAADAKNKGQELKQDAQQKAGDLEGQASQKADQAKDKANEVPADAKNKGQ
ncbi:unnamed protein product, partial [Didymodactylos carnosus]